MNRKIVNSMEILFDIVKMKFDLTSTGILPVDFDNKRWIKGKELDKTWLAKSKFQSVSELSIDVKFSLISFENENYFCTIGIESPDKLPIGLVQENLNAGIFTAIISELELQIKPDINNLYLEQYILSQNDFDPLYKGHDFADLVTIFPNIYLSRITSQYSLDKDNLNQLICNYLTLNRKFLFLPFKNETLNNLNHLILIDSKILSYETIIQALFSSQFKFAFLDLYRCIELLYQLIYTDDTHAQLKLDINRSIFLLALENNLGWRPTERSSLIKIFNETPSAFKESIIIAIKEINPNIKDHGNWVYDLRCSIVHLKSIQKTFELKSEHWEKLLLGISDLLCYWYSKYPHFE